MENETNGMVSPEEVSSDNDQAIINPSQNNSQKKVRKASKPLLKKFKEGELLSPVKKKNPVKTIILIFVIISVVAAIVWPIINNYFNKKSIDSRPRAIEFKSEDTYPANPNVTRIDGNIVLNPVNEKELIFAGNKLESKLEGDLSTFGINEDIAQIKSIFRYKTNDENFDKQRDVIEIIAGNSEKTFAIQYFDEFSKDREDPLNYENETKTLASFTKFLGSCAPYNVIEFDDETRDSDDYDFFQKNGKSQARFVKYNEDFSSGEVYSRDEDDAELTQKIEDLEAYYQEVISAYNLSNEKEMSQ